jgi:lipoate-protein ligase A
MAIDQALLERAGRHGERWLRLYRWAPWCLSFGRHEPAARRYDRSAIAGRRLATVRRPTGGRAVWHARELTYAVAVPSDWRPGGLTAAYLEIHGMLRDALRRLGAEAELAPRHAVPALGAGACFARPVGGELTVAGRKVVGSAQLREGGGVLQHGAILLQDDQSLIGLVTRGDPPADGAAPLERLLGRPLPADEVASAVRESAESRWPGEWASTGTQPGVLREAREHLPRFSSETWTWRA